VKTKHNTEKFKVIFNGDLKRIVSWSMDDFDVMKRMEILTCGDGLQNIVKEWEAYCNMVGDYDTDNPQATDVFLNIKTRTDECFGVGSFDAMFNGEHPLDKSSSDYLVVPVMEKMLYCVTKFHNLVLKNMMV